MRPPSETQSTLRAPLNHILGTQANVRILRVLASTTAPLGKTEVARRTRLNASGVRRTISQLIDLGIVDSVGTGSRRLVRLRKEHPLATPLEALFGAEAARFEQIIDDLRSAVGQLRPPPRAAWIQGSVATESDAAGDPIIVGVLSLANQVESAVEQISADFCELERKHDVTISVQGWTSADLATLEQNERRHLEKVIPLFGPPLQALSPEGRSTETAATRGTTHEDLDRRALSLARAIAERLSEDPSLVQRARKYIAGRLEQASPGEQKELREWDQLLCTMSPVRLGKFLVDPGERATRLRQTLPFLHVLSDEERDGILKEATP